MNIKLIIQHSCAKSTKVLINHTKKYIDPNSLIEHVCSVSLESLKVLITSTSKPPIYYLSF